MGTVKEILYFDKPDRTNSDEMVKFAKKRMDDLGVRNVVIVWSSGYTMRKFQEVVKGEKLNIVAVTNPSPNSPAKGTMPIIIRDTDNEETRKQKSSILMSNTSLMNYLLVGPAPTPDVNSPEPPLTHMLSPVVYDDSSEARNKAAFAISVVVPILFKGTARCAIPV